jgi:hypothetical protein
MHLEVLNTLGHDTRSVAKGVHLGICNLSSLTSKQHHLLQTLERVVLVGLDFEDLANSK